MDIFEVLAIAQYAITALSSGFNAGYFWCYRSPQKQRRVGAAVLTVVSLAMLVESLFFGLYALLVGQQWPGGFAPDARHWLLAGMLACLGSVLISAIILRRLVEKRGSG